MIAAVDDVEPSMASEGWPAMVFTPGRMVVFDQQNDSQSGVAMVLGMRFDYPIPEPALAPVSRPTLGGTPYSDSFRNIGVTAAFWPGSATIDVFSMRSSGLAIGHDGFAADLSSHTAHDNVNITGLISMVAAVATSATTIELFGLSAQRAVLRATLSSGVLGPWSSIGI